MTAARGAGRLASLGRSALLYATALLAGSALFFTLHYVGNRIPYDLALEKALTELDSDRPDLGRLSRLSAPYEYCQRVAATLAAAKPLPGDSSLVDAILPRTLTPGEPLGYCDAIRRIPTSDALGQSALGFRYWWGSGSFYAIALRFLSDADIREWTRALTIFAWGMLVLVLWFLSRKAFLAIAPLGIFAAFFSGLQYFSDAANGFPFLLAPLSGIALALVMSRRSLAHAAPLCCFVIGMASSYLWLLDGHNILVVVLIGLVAYFGSLDPSARRRAANAARLIGLYAAGFTACYALGQLVKAAVAQWAPGIGWASAKGVFQGFFGQVSVRNDRLADTLAQAFAGDWTDAPIIRDFTPYWIMGPDRVAFGQLVTLLSATAFAVSLAFAAALFVRRRKSLLADLALIIALAMATTLQLILPDDLPNRSSRYLFIAHALCWSSFLLAAKEAFVRWKETAAPAEEGASASAQGNRRSRRAAGRMRREASSRGPRLRFPQDAAVRAFLVLTAIAAVVAAAGFGSLPLRSESAFARETIEETQPRIFGRFNVYYNEGKLVYARAECDEYDAAPRFFLHLLPADPNDLPEERQGHSFDNPNFYFTEHKVPYGGGCAAVVNLPDYEITAISTGQYVSGERQLWRGEFSPNQPPRADAAAMTALLDGAELLAQSEFTIHRNGNTLLWTKSPCANEDLLAQFFLHLVPVNVDDLPEERKQHGFDNLDFNFLDHGALLLQEGRCIAARELPDYPAASARTGQFAEGGALWGEAFDLIRREPSQADAAAMTALLDGAELLAQSEFNIHRNGNTLLLTKSPCADEDVLPRFSLHVVPVNVDDLPEERKRFGFDNLDFNFHDHGVLLSQGGRCIAARELPDYPAASIGVGQFAEGGALWGETFELIRREPSLADAAAMTALLNGAELLAQSEFTIHRNGNTLLLTKSPCADEDLLAQFFLHVVPVNVADLPEDRKEHGFDNLDFNFHDHGVLPSPGGRCIAARELPDYPAASIGVGQFAEGGALWGEAFDFRQ